MHETRIVIAVVLGLTALKLLIYTALAGGSLATALCHWDCSWYLSIATQGYDAAPHLVTGFWQANWAFFPLYPLLIRGVDAAVGAAPVTAGVAISTVCFVVFAIVAARHRQITRDEHDVWTWPLLVTVWPYSFVFHPVYSEALYAALATAGLLALAARRPFAAGCASAFLTATRPTGIVLAAWIGGERLWRARSAGSLPRIVVTLLPAAIAPAGLLLFMLWLYLKLGDPLAFAHIQTAWQHSTRNPLAVLWDGFATLRPGPSYLGAWAFLGLGAAGWLIARRRFAEAWLCGATVMMALSTGTLWSMPRFVAANPAFLLAVADVFALVRWRWARAAILVVLAAIQLVFLTAWYRGATFLS